MEETSKESTTWMMDCMHDETANAECHCTTRTVRASSYLLELHRTLVSCSFSFPYIKLARRVLEHRLYVGEMQVDKVRERSATERPGMNAPSCMTTLISCPRVLHAHYQLLSSKHCTESGTLTGPRISQPGWLPCKTPPPP